MEEQSNPECPHCQTLMMCWGNPQLSNWSGEFQFVCFNDECPYFVRGWAWMQEQYQVTASYRHRLDPTSGETGPLPVWSKEALKSGIIYETDTDNSQKD